MGLKGEINHNRIVRVRSQKMHKLIIYVARLTSTPYQQVFDTLCEYLLDGHVIGEYSAQKLIEIQLRKNLVIKDIPF